MVNREILEEKRLYHRGYNHRATLADLLLSALMSIPAISRVLHHYHHLSITRGQICFA